MQLPKPSAPVSWTVEVDPAAHPVAFERKADFQIPIPEHFGGDAVVFPSVTSPFVAVGNNWDDKKVREVWNFVSQKRVGAISGIRIWGQNYRLSPDGVYFAFTAHGGKGPHVIDAAGAKDLGEFELGSWIEVMEFAGSARLIASARDTNLKVWTLPSGELEREVPLPERLVKESLSVSPGGRYVAVCSAATHQVSVLDLNTGQTAGVIDVPLDADGHEMNCKDLEFSPDGQEFAGLFERSNKWRLVVWDVAQGSVADEFALADLNSLGSRGSELQWFPGRQRWLLKGRAILDRDSEAVVWTLPDLGPCLVIDDNRILAKTKFGRRDVVAPYKLPESEIAKATEVIASGGTAADVGLPPVTTGDLDSLVSIPLDEVGGVWAVQADPAPQPAAPLLPQPVQLKPSAGQIKNMLLTRADAARAVLMYASTAAARPTRNQNTSRPDRNPVWLEVYDLLEGNRVDTLEIEFASELIAVSPSGQYAMMRLATTGERVDVWDLTTKEHSVGWRPYQKLPGEDGAAIRVVGQQQGQTDRTVIGAAFIDDTHVLTMNRKNTIIMWELPACRAVYEIQNASKPGISPGGKYIVVSSGRGFRFFEALTGQPCGDLQSAGTLQCAAFHPDGERFAVVFNDGKGVSCTCWNLPRGEITDEFRLPTNGQILQWSGANYLLLNGDTLVDLQRKMVAWKYELPSGVRAPVSPDDQHWFLASRPGSSAVYLAAAQLPEPKVSEYLEQNNVQPDYVIQPGETVTVMINLADPPGHPNFRSRMYQNIIDKYKQSNITVQLNQRVELAFSMTHRNTGETHRYHMFGRPGDITISEQVVDCVATVKRDGEVVWEQKSRFSNAGGFFMRIPEGVGVDEYLRKQMWDSAANHYLNFTPPAYVFPKSAAEGLGHSLLTPEGVVTSGL